MAKSYTFWFKTSIVLQFLTGVFHLLSFVNPPVPANDTEKQLFALMSDYKFDLGFGFVRSIENLMNSFSMMLSVFLFFSGILNLFLLRSQVPDKTMKGIILINLGIYFISFIIMFMLTFLPPVVCLGCMVISLFISFFRLRTT